MGPAGESDLRECPLLQFGWFKLDFALKFRFFFDRLLDSIETNYLRN